MKKKCTYDFKKNRNGKTKQWLGLLLLCIVLAGQMSFAQLYQVAGNCTMISNSNIYGPIYSTTNPDATNRTAVIYPASQLIGIAEQELTSIYFERAGTSVDPLTGTPNLKIYLKETSDVNFGEDALDWDTVVAGATLVYDSNPITAIGSGIGLKQFTFSDNFTYSGTNNLILITEYVNTGNTVAAQWRFEYTAPCVNTLDSNTTKYINNTTGTLGASLTTPNFRRPFILFGFNVNCPAPGNVTVSDITTTTATVTWTAGATETTWEYVLQPQGAGLFSSFTSATSTILNLAGLNPVTNYEFFIRAVCGEDDGESAWAGPFSFTTDCGPIASGFSENFDTTPVGTFSSPTVPHCWNFIGNAGSGYVVAPAAANYNSSPNSFFIANSSDISGNYILVSPETENLGNGNYRVRFFARTTSSSSPSTTLVFGTLTDNTDAGTFTALGTFTLTTTLTEYKINLPAGTADYFGFRHGVDSNNRTIYIDDVVYEEKPACLEVYIQSLNVANITVTSADLSWEGTGAFDIEYGVAGFTPTGTPNSINETGVSNPFTLTGLTPATSYEYYVRQNCSLSNDGYSTWTGPFSFITACIPAASGFSENFDTTPAGTASNLSFPPVCWNFIDEGAGYGYVGAANHNSSPNSFHIANVSDVSGNYILVSPETENLGNGNYRVRFFAKTTTLASSPPTTLVFGTLTDNTDAGTFTALETFTLTTTYTEYKIDLPAGTADYFGFKHGVDAVNRFINIDDVVYEEKPVCLEPYMQALNATNITAVSADLSWDSTGVSFDIEYGAAGFTPTDTPNSTNETGVSNPFTLTELTPDTTYEYYVRQNCSLSNDGYSTWTGPFSFTTTCIPIASGFSENFDTTPVGSLINSSVPDCWNFIDEGAGGGYLTAPDTANYNSNPNSFLIYNSFDEANYILVSPVTENLGNGDYRVRFFAKTASTSDSPFTTLIFGTLTDNTDAGTFAALEAFTLTTAFTEYKVNLPAGTADYFGFKHGTFGTTSSISIYIDDVIYEEKPICLEPYIQSLKATNITTTSADLSWDSTGVSFDIEYGLTGFIPTGTPNSANETGISNPFTLTGLTPATAYDYYIRQDCSLSNDGYSAWTRPFTFTTLCVPVDSFFEDFENYDTGNIVPDCWSRIISGLNNTQTIADTSPAASGTRHISQQSYGFSNATIVVLPPVNNIDAGTHWLRFKARVTSGTGHLQVGYITDITDESTFVEVLPLTITNTVYTTEDAEYVVPFSSSTPSNARIAIRNPGTSSAQHFWDDVYWEPAPACMYPLNLAAANISASSTSLSWNSYGNFFDIEYGITGFTPTGNPNSENETDVSNSFVLTGLIPDTTYQYYVRQDCGMDNGVSSWTGPFEFTTGFYMGNIPTMFNTNPSIEDYSCAYESISIEVPEGEQLVSLNVQYTMNSFNGAWISQQRSVLYSPTLNAGETDVVAGEEDYPGSITYNRDVDFANGATGTVEFVLKAWRTANGAGCNTDYVYVTDGTWILTFETELIPTCPNPPTGLGYTNITEDSVDLIWESEEGTLFEVRWGTVGFDPEDEEGALISGITTTSYTLSGLDSSIAYEFYVRRDCSVGDEEDYGDWAGPFKFNSGHCLPTSQLTQYITAFSTGLALENISYTSTAMNPGGYGNKTDLVVSREPGESFTFSTNFIGGQNAVRIWVDWNHNFLFEEDEEVFSGSNPGPGNLVTGSVAIPAGAVPGNYVMRVRTVYGASASPQPCGQVQYGEALDFTLHVTCVIAAPVGEAAQAFTPGQTLADLDVEGTGLTWYAEETLSTVLENSTELVHGTTYYVISSDDDCQSEVLAITVTEEVSTASFDRYAFKYYPNPVNDVLYFSSDTPISDVTVINMLGQKLNVLVQPDNTRVDMTGLPSGNYFIRITIEGINKVFKVIKH